MKKIFIISALFFLPMIVSAATLSISPSTKNVNTGEVFNVEVILDTQGQQIDGVDLRYLNYNKSLMEAQSITPGSLMPATLAKTIDASNGRITFSQVITAGGSKYSGSGTLATITFRALASGTASVTLDHTSGNTTDSNIAAVGKDILSSVAGASFTIQGSAVAPTSIAVSNSSFVFSSNLSLGSRGAEVTELQKFLVSQGYATADSITGYFGPATEVALQKFQAAQGIVSSGSPATTGYGSFGPSTRAKVNSLKGSSSGGAVAVGTTNAPVTGSLTRNLYRGLKGDDVTILQRFLVSQGYTTADNVTGFFGPITEATVKKFQAAQGIVSSGSPATTGYGNVGPSTRARINALLGSSSVSNTSTGATQSTQSLQVQIDAMQKQVQELLLKLQKAQ